MRYSEFARRNARLEKAIAEYWSREVKAETGNGPWFVLLFPGLRSSTIAVANRKRLALINERHRLQRAYFGDPACMWNADAVNAFRRTVPSSPDAVSLLRTAADAALAADE